MQLAGVECQDGMLMRWIYVPAGMTRTEALRQLEAADRQF